MVKYNKIDTVFERSTEGQKKLIEGQFRNKEVEYLKDNMWYFTEKFDGTNVRVHWDGHKVKFYGRTDKAQLPNGLIEALEDMFGGTLNEELFEQKFGENEAILFGEGYGPKIQKGGSYRNDISFILFDVMVNNMYLNRDAIEEVAKCFNIDCVPIIMTGTIAEAVDFVKTSPNSTMGIAKMEGLVGKPMVELYSKVGKRMIVKIKSCDFNI